MMNNDVKNNCMGACQIALGSYIGYKGIEHGLPRALGIRTEFHTTTKENAKLIKQSGNILDPHFGGKGFSIKSNINDYVLRSKDYVHITGLNSQSEFYQNIKPDTSGKLKFLRPLFRTYARKFINLGYKCFGNADNVKLENGLPVNIKTIFGNKTKTFYVPGIDSYFENNFIADKDELFALKSSKPVKVYNNKFSAMIAGVKEFGLQGIAQNKSRVLFGTTLVVSGIYCAYKLLNKGIHNIIK